MNNVLFKIILLIINNLKTIAEINSPAMEKLVSQEKTLNESLINNINELNYYQNNFKLYN